MFGIKRTATLRCHGPGRFFAEELKWPWNTFVAAQKSVCIKSVCTSHPDRNSLAWTPCYGLENRFKKIFIQKTCLGPEDWSNFFHMNTFFPVALGWYSSVHHTDKEYMQTDKYQQSKEATEKLNPEIERICIAPLQSLRQCGPPEGSPWGSPGPALSQPCPAMSRTSGSTKSSPHSQDWAPPWEWWWDEARMGWQPSSANPMGGQGRAAVSWGQALLGNHWGRDGGSGWMTQHPGPAEAGKGQSDPSLP